MKNKVIAGILATIFILSGISTATAANYMETNLFR